MTAIISLTQGGYKLSKRIAKVFKKADLYTLNPEGRDNELVLPLKKFTKIMFGKYDNIIFVMAVGITIRVIAPYIKDKSKDPAIVSVDERGSFVVSLLSGHLGGANRLTRKIAQGIGATPVITTASEVLETKSVDMIALDEGFEIESMEDAKRVTSLVVNRKKVGVYSSVPIYNQLPKEYIVCNSIKELKIRIEKEEIQGALIIGSCRYEFFENVPKSMLIPKNTVVGIGCRRGKSTEEISKFIEETLDEFNIYKESIFKIATAWVKKDEKGIIEASKKFNSDLIVYEKNELERVHNKFKKSKFVEKITGLGNIADSCGYLASNKGETIMYKREKDGITLSIWEKKGEV